MLAQDTGVLCAATAFGKTAVGAYLVAQRKINTLVLVHNAEIMKNQLKAFEKFLQIDEVLPEYTTPKGRHKKLPGIIGTLFCGRNRLGRMHTSACWNPCTTNGCAPTGHTVPFHRSFPFVSATLAYQAALSLGVRLPVA